MMSRTSSLVGFLAAFFVLSPAFAQPAPVTSSVPKQTQPAAAVPPAASPVAPLAPVLPDVSREPTLFVVAYAHLDTQWRWCYPQSIREYLPATLHTNFRFFEKYPNYVFNFSGSRRYQMMKEYYPDDYARLKSEIAAGNWFPCGSSVDENDANVPSAESYIRHVLYGNRFFRREFGVASDEFMLPDCFGFPAAVPSLLAHCGVKGFSTQKLTWNAVVPIPFKVGVWEGPDGRGVIAALDPGSYGGEVLENLATSDGWAKRIAANGRVSGVLADYHYYGTGDQGGGPTDRSVAMMETSMSTDGPVKIVSGPADQLFHAITPDMRARLPKYKGELQLTEHSAGSITSQAYMKRWNRKNELLADAAEKASVAAAWLGGRDYPAQKLEDAWTLVLGSQMHDILPGTSHPRAYDFAWNDEALAANMFSSVLTDAVGVVASTMNTLPATDQGTSLVLFNPLSVEREDVVEAEIPGDIGAFKGVVVKGADGAPVPAQILDGTRDSVRIAFIARVPSVGFASYRAALQAAPATQQNTMRVDTSGLENARYRVQLDATGNVASIQDKKNANRELLSGPATLGLHYENPKNWPAWNQDWSDRQLPVKETVGGPARVRVIESGPARVALEITREVGSSTFVQRIRLAEGSAGDRVEFDCTIDWAARERSLRAAFPLSVTNAKATYDIQTGTLERGNAQPKQYEYAFQQWFDLTDASGSYGVTVISDSKYGADKPTDNLVRLTLLHTPGVQGGYQDQATQDLGRHRVLYALSGHTGDWRHERSAEQAARLNQPILAFRATPHNGTLGASFSLLSVSDPHVRITALKHAEHGGEIIVRLRELSGQSKQGVLLSAPGKILAAREVDGQERPIGTAALQDGSLQIDIGGYELRAFALKLADPPARAARCTQAGLSLPFDTDVVASRANRADGSFDPAGNAYPAEQFPTQVIAEDAVFALGSAQDKQNNALSCNGQEIPLPSGEFDRLYLLASTSAGDITAPVIVNDRPVSLNFRSWTSFVGQWDRRLWLGDVPELTFNWNNDLGGIEPGYMTTQPVAWHCSHYSTPKGDTHYLYCSLYKMSVDLPKGARSIRLPNDPRIRIFAATAVNSGNCAPVVPAAPLFDELRDHTQDAPRIVAASGPHADATEVRIEPRMYWSPGSIRYTLDGTTPTSSSPVYSAPLILSRTATVTAAVFSTLAAPGPHTSSTITINDTTAPSIKRAVANYLSPLLAVSFSEPLDAEPQASSFSITPPITINSVELSPDHTSALLHLAAPPEVDKTYTLTAGDIKDMSPAANTTKSASTEFRVAGPVYSKDIITPDLVGKPIHNVPGLPTKGTDSWTLNIFVRTDKQPPNRTVIAGFGKCEDGAEGTGRYLSKFASGLQFWACNRDLPSKSPLDLNRWQMLTTTYDGTTLRMYKDAVKISERKQQLANDDNVVNFCPPDPWENKRIFAGELRHCTIWNSALGEQAIKSLKDSAALP